MRSVLSKKLNLKEWLNIQLRFNQQQSSLISVFQECQIDIQLDENLLFKFKNQLVYNQKTNKISLLLFLGVTKPQANCHVLQNSKDFNIQYVQKNQLNLKPKIIIGSIKPTLLQDDYQIKIFLFLQEKTKKIMKGSQNIYLGTRDGLNAESFWQRCDNKENLLIVFKSKISLDYTLLLNGWISDDTLSSLIFSQIYDQVYPLKNKNAIYCTIELGPNCGNDMYINGNFVDGYSRLGEYYQFDQYKGNAYNPYLYGQEQPEIQECEIYQLTLN